MKARCPKSRDHLRFVTTAHVQEEWVVDQHGNWIETRETLDTVHGPDAGNIWTCAWCGARAEVRDY